MTTARFACCTESQTTEREKNQDRRIFCEANWLWIWLSAARGTGHWK
jgi:hypothetical protein